MKCINHKIIKNFVCESITEKVLQHYNVCSVNAWVIRLGIEQQGAWFLEVAQHQLVLVVIIEFMQHHPSNTQEC